MQMTHHLNQSAPGATPVPAHPSRWAKQLGALTMVLCLPMLVHALTPAERLQKTQARAAGPQEPCPFFDVAIVYKIFPHSSNEATFKRRDKPFPSCTYIWNAKHMNTVKMGGLEAKVPSEGRLTLTQVATRNEAQDWKRVLTSYSKLQLTQVPELGQYAVWSPQRRQLSWIAKGHIFHVAVEDADQPEDQQVNAMAVAAELIRTY
jgi:hypothetical protein